MKRLDETAKPRPIQNSLFLYSAPISSSDCFEGGASVSTVNILAIQLNKIVCRLKAVYILKTKYLQDCCFRKNGATHSDKRLIS